MAHRFSLASVLRFRESLEQQEELALRKLQLEVAGLQRSIEQATTEIAIAHQARERAMQQPIAAAQFQAMLRASEAAIERKKKMHLALHKLEEQRAEQMRRYQAAHRDRQMLSDLAEQQRDAYEIRQVKTQQKMVDDLFASRHRRG